MSEITITLVSADSGQSESLPLSTTTKVSELAEWAKALFGVSTDVNIFKDGSRLQPSASLGDAGVTNGDLLAAQSARAAAAAAAARPAAPAAATAPRAGAGGLDFSNLLGQAPAPSASATTTSSHMPTPVYYPGMSLSDAMQYNPHPQSFVSLLQSKEHLFKELNYHNPSIASKLRNQTLEQATQIWREELVKGGIQKALQVTTRYHEEQEMKRRLAQNPNDPQAKEYFAKQQRKEKVQQQYEQMMNEYPESLGRVLMLYVEAKINGHSIQAFCDSGAQATIMSKRLAEECGLTDYIDTRFAGTAVGVGTGKILGRIHIVQLEINDHHFPCSVTVMDDPSKGANEMPFLLGLDMMKRHTCQLDLEKGLLKFRLAPGQYMETPFLHEKDLDESKGGTKGFDAAKANQELAELEQKRQANESNKKKDGDNDMKD